MADKEERKGQGFTVVDRRFASKSDSEKEESIREESVKPQKKEGETLRESFREQPVREDGGPGEEISLSGLVFSISHSALVQMGEVPDPVTNAKGKDLTLAKQSIDIIALLQEKTKGNQTKEEEALFENILYDLRMRFVHNSRNP